MSQNDKELYRGLSYAAWGYFFIHVNLSLNNFNILPDFVGYLLLLAAIGLLAGERRDLKLLRPLCILLAVWQGVDWLLAWAGERIGGMFLPLDLIVATAVLYFHFQFLTDMAAIAETYQPEEDDLDRRLRLRRTVYLVFLTATDVLLYLPVGRDWEWRAAAVVVMAVVGLLTAISIMLSLFELRRLFREEEPDTPDV